MDDRTLVNSGMAYAQKTMETGEDVIQALLAALAGRTVSQQKTTLEEFAQYAKMGGKLTTIQFEIAHLENFHMVAKEMGLKYYAIRDRRTEQAMIIYREGDAVQLYQVVKELAERGRPLYQDPQLSISDFLEKNEGEGIMYSPVESLEQIEAAKWEAVKRKVEFAIGKQQDGCYFVICHEKDVETLKEVGIVDRHKPIVNLSQVFTMETVKQIVHEQQKEEAEKKNNRQSQKNQER